MKREQQIVWGTALALVLTTALSLVGYSTFPALQPQILFLLIVFSAWTSVLALYWALYGVYHFYSEVDKAKTRVKEAVNAVPEVTGTVLGHLMEFESWWNKLPYEKRDSMAKSLNMVLDLLWAKIKQLEKRGY